MGLFPCVRITWHMDPPKSVWPGAYTTQWNNPNKLWANCGARAAERESKGPKAKMKKMFKLKLFVVLCFGWLSLYTIEGPPSSVNTPSILKKWIYLPNLFQTKNEKEKIEPWIGSIISQHYGQTWIYKLWSFWGFSRAQFLQNDWRVPLRMRTRHKFEILGPSMLYFHICNLK